MPRECNGTYCSIDGTRQCYRQRRFNETIPRGMDSKRGGQTMETRIDLNSLLLFYEVVNASSITQAAGRLRIPKSTISRKLALLEEQMGTMLLRKSTRRLHTTDIGAAFYEHCARIAQEFEDARLQTSEMQTDLRGTLRVALPMDFGVVWLSHTVCEFSRLHPEIQFEIELSNRPVVLLEERFDIAIHLGPLQESRLISRPVGRLRRGVYASPGYLKRRGIPGSIEDVGTHDCVLTEIQRREGIWSFRKRSRDRTVEISGKLIVNSTALARELVIGGMGLGVLPNLMCINAVRSGRLVRVLTEWEAPSLQANALILNRSRIPQRTRVFLEFMASALASDDELGLVSRADRRQAKK